MSDPYYQDEHVTLYHGDCLEHPEWWSEADVLVTDPPYGLGKRMGGTFLHHKAWPLYQEQALGEGLRWDQEAPSAVAHMPERFDRSIIWGGNYFPLPPQRGWLIWDKQNRQTPTGHAELAWTDLDQPIRTFDWNTEGFLNGKEPMRKSHPTQKPLALMQWCLQFLDPAKAIADPFSGSGSTLVAAKLLGRHAVGVELEERYCEIAARRLSQGVLDFGEWSA